VGPLLDLELLLTDAFLVYGFHLTMGRIHPETIDPEWQANRREADFAQVLQKALDSNRIEETLKSMVPPQPGYSRLRGALASYRDLAGEGGWPLVPEGPTMQKGHRGERVVALRRRLIATGDVTEPLNNDDMFDDDVEQAVRRFQDRHGLDVDGVVGKRTLAALNVPAEDRVRQIELNMERWRWLPQDLGMKYILINIANFELDVVEHGREVLKMRVVVGKDYRRTPVFSDTMTYLVLNPYWHVPQSIAIQDILPLIKKDCDYLMKHNMKVLQGWDLKGKEIDPQKIEWSEITAQNFNYRFRQEPGPHNALGRFKFMFPNAFNVYLHDTPGRELFGKSERTFSSGCIRIEKPIELAQYVLKDNPKWTRATLLAAIEMQREQAIPLPEPIPVHLLYLTAWLDQNGTVQFRRDIYGRDSLLQEALGEGPPAYTKMN